MKGNGNINKYHRDPKHPNTYEYLDDYVIINIHSETNGDFKVFVDSDDIDMLQKYHWGITKSRSYIYAYERFYVYTQSNKAKGLQIQRLIMGCPKGMVVDHIDGNTMNNCKNNLRVCTRDQNNINKKMFKNNKTGHTGVHYVTENYNNRWLANIRLNNKLICLGYYSTYEEAVKVREEAEKKYHGEFSRVEKD
jgi:hypothetical protein